MHIQTYNQQINPTAINITVCSKQYDSLLESDRGFGDIAHGIRVIQLVTKKLPNSTLRFIIEYSGDERERKIIKVIVSSNKVDHIILSRKLS